MNLNDLTLNVLSAIIVSVILATHARKDLIMISFIVYALYLGISLFVVGGGQLNAAIAMSAVLYAVFQWSTNDMIKVTATSYVSQYEKVPIFDGSIMMNSNTHKVFDTYDPQHPSYRRLSNSQNRQGGSQYTYSFWLKMGASINDDIIGKTLFIRGDKREFKPKYKSSPDDPFQNYFQSSDGKGITICNPRVYFKRPNTLAIQINTDRDLVFEAEVGSEFSDQDLRKNILSLIPKHWAMITIVVEDNVPINDFENGVSIRTYLNDSLYSTSVTHGSLRLNNGPLHCLCHDVWPGESMMADFTYYNYALSDSAVRRRFNRGVTTDASNDINSTRAKDENEVINVSAYNTTDRYNYDTNLDSSNGLENVTF